MGHARRGRAGRWQTIVPLTVRDLVRGPHLNTSLDGVDDKGANSGQATTPTAVVAGWP